MTPNRDFKVKVLRRISENGAFLRKSYYRTIATGRLSNGTSSMILSDSDSDWKVAVFFDIRYVKNGAR